MALSELLKLTQSRKKIGLSEERLKPIMPAIRSYIAFWREYPDLFVDFLQTGGDPERKKELNYPVVRAIKNVNENESEYP